MIPETSETLRLYAWVPRGEVAYLQAILDGYEGVARVRTERHDTNGHPIHERSKHRSLLLFLLQSDRKEEFLDILRYLSTEVTGSIELI